MTSQSISFVIKNRLSELCALHQSLQQFGKDIGLTPRVLFMIELVLEEVGANIITHGYPDGGEHWIDIDLRYENGILTIRIEDDGIAFNPATAEGPDLECPLERRNVGGLGVHLMKTFMNGIDYQRKGNRNILTIWKQCANQDCT